jgi:hypothetical protein
MNRQRRRKPSWDSAESTPGYCPSLRKAAVVCPGTSDVNVLGESAGKLGVIATVPLPRSDASPGTPAGLNQVVGAEIDPVSNEIIAVTGLGRVFVVDLTRAKVVAEQQVLDPDRYVALHSTSLDPDGALLFLGTGQLGVSVSRIEAHTLTAVDTATWKVIDESSIASTVSIQALPGDSLLILGSGASLVSDVGDVVVRSTISSIQRPSLTQVVLG